MGLSLSSFKSICSRHFGHSCASVPASAWLLPVAHAGVETAVDLRLICFTLPTRRKMLEQLLRIEEVALAQLVCDGASCVLLMALAVVPGASCLGLSCISFIAVAAYG